MTMLTGWAKYIKISVDADVIDAALSGFPVPVYISASSGIGDVDVSCVFDELGSDANRKKIAVTTSDGTTQCYVEIERWDHASEKAWLHVKLPSVSADTDTDLYLYYDSSQADNTTYVGDTTDAAAKSVWDSNFIAVYHMDADPSSSLIDSTGNHNATSYNLSTDDQTETIPPGRGLDFDGSSEYADTGINADLSTLSVEVVTSSPSAPASRTGADGPIYRDKKISIIWDHESATYRGKVTGDFSGTWPVLSLGTLSGSTIYHLAATFGGGSLTAYNAGVQTDQATGKTITSDTSKRFYIAKHDTNAQYYQGTIYAVRISDTARSAAWLKATYHGLFDSLLTFGTEQIAEIDILLGAASLRVLPKQVAGFQWDISGTVQEGGSPVARTVRAYKRSDGSLVDSTVSDDEDGSFSFEDVDPEPHFVVALDDDAGDVFNALILDRVKPGQDFS